MPTPSTSDLRRALKALTTLAAGDIDRLLRQVDDADTAREALNDVLPALIETYGSAAATVTADWYDERRAAAAVARRFEAIPAAVGDRGAEALAGYTASKFVTADEQVAKSTLLGGLELRIFDVGRDTVMDSTFRDPSARGWQRETDGNACAFCEMLAGRGSVYSEQGADFASHDFCGCMAVPAFDGEPVPVKPYTPSSRNITDADRARVKAWISANP